MRLRRRRSHGPVDFRLGNAEQRHAEAPRSFFIPSRQERESLAPGDLAKLLFEVVDPRDDMPGAERMWVQVTQVDGLEYVGALDNDPAVITTVGAGSPIAFGPEHVIALADDWPLLGKRVYVSRRSQVEDLRPRYLYREPPDDDADSGWRAFVGDETDDEVNDPANVLVQPLGYLLDRWPDLRSLLEEDPAEGEWEWDDDTQGYRAIGPY